MAELTKRDVIMLLNGNKNFAGLDLSDLDLSGMNFSGANMERSNLSNAKLENAVFQRTILSNANLQSAILTDADLHGVNLKLAQIGGAKFKGANLYNADLSGVIAFYTKVWYVQVGEDDFEVGESHDITADFTNANLQLCRFNDANFSELDLSNKDLKGSSFKNAKLNGTSFSFSHLSGADFSGSHLYGTSFYKCNLSQANFSDSQIGNVYFGGANLTDAKFLNARIHKAAFVSSDSGVYFKNEVRPPVCPAIMPDGKPYRDGMDITVFITGIHTVDEIDNSSEYQLGEDGRYHDSEYFAENYGSYSNYKRLSEEADDMGFPDADSYKNWLDD